MDKQKEIARDFIVTLTGFIRQTNWKRDDWEKTLDELAGDLVALVKEQEVKEDASDG